MDHDTDNFPRLPSPLAVSTSSCVSMLELNLESDLTEVSLTLKDFSCALNDSVVVSLGTSVSKGTS